MAEIGTCVSRTPPITSSGAIGLSRKPRSRPKCQSRRCGYFCPIASLTVVLVRISKYFSDCALPNQLQSKLYLPRRCRCASYPASASDRVPILVEQRCSCEGSFKVSSIQDIE